MGNNQTLTKIGEQFNDVTSLLEGGVPATNKPVILTDLHEIQNNLRDVVQQEEHSGTLTGLSAIHLQNVEDQFTLEIHTVQAVGSDANAPKEVNDIQRDLIDIIQGDPTLSAQAGDGFGAVPGLLVPAAKFQDNAAQTAFWAQYVIDSNNLGAKAVQLVTEN